jgi:hypothetical protein
VADPAVVVEEKREIGLDLVEAAGVRLVSGVIKRFSSSLAHIFVSSTRWEKV